MLILLLFIQHKPQQLQFGQLLLLVQLVIIIMEMLEVLHVLKLQMLLLLNHPQSLNAKMDFIYLQPMEDVFPVELELLPVDLQPLQLLH
jgi:hypothetical protein